MATKKINGREVMKKERTIVTIEGAAHFFIQEMNLDEVIYLAGTIKNIANGLARGEIESPDKVPLFTVDPNRRVYSDSVLKFLGFGR
jgi:hypothetical protein